MTIWLLTLLLLAALAGLGYRQGAIRVAFSLVGIVLGGLLALPLAGAIKPLLALCGVKNPLLLALIPPCIVFLVVLTIFKVAGLIVHKKAEVYYKYHSGDLRLVLWERLNHRLGLCAGLLNGTAYLVIISTAVYTLSYWTYQMASSDSDPSGVRLLNRLGKDLQSTGLTGVAKAVDRMPPAYYDTADVVGLIYHTPLLEARLSRYPAFLSLGERPEFQDLASDAQFTELRQKQASIMDVINYPKVQAMLKNPEVLNAISAALIPNLKDLRAYLESGKSEQFDSQKILGRWEFDVNGTVGLLRKAKPNMSPTEAARLRATLAATFMKTSFVAAPGQQAFLKNVPHVRVSAGAPPTTEFQTLIGQWKESGASYELSFTIENVPTTLTGEIVGERLTVTGSGMNLSFVREE
jgi:uncharacterized membrane protein required for colicin V production